MGTRHLTRVYDRTGTLKVAQYGQWDGYPEGQGLDALRILMIPTLIERLEANLTKVRWAEEEDIDKVYESLHLPTDGWLTIEQGDRFTKAAPHFSRDTGVEILKLIADTILEELPLKDSREFINDELFCEWAYTVDFSQDNFQVWTAGETIVSFKLDRLPTEDEFVAMCRKQASALVS